jgi:DNA-binding transcriptional MerR regulator
MKMEKKKFRIGELAQKVGVERFVIRFWEKEFGLESERTTGGQRFYSNEDLSQFAQIKELLYKKGFTINGAKKQLETQGPHSSTTSSSHKDLLAHKTDWNPDELATQICSLKKQLKKLSEML